jgi:carbamoyl-phosphate synthase large subunit
VQYHPEAGPGPERLPRLFDEFIAHFERGRAMPRRDDIQKILVLGSGPIVIGQAAEFDYSGAQACKVLLEEGYEVVLVNSNPATIMTDPEFATATYVEPLLPGPVAQVIERERPDALLPTLGGQTALNLAKALSEDGTLERYGVELIGANYDAINRAEDRELFDATMQAAGLRTARNTIATSIEQARAARETFGPAADHPSRLHARRPRRRHRPDRGGLRAHRQGRPRRLADRPDPHRRVRARLGGVRARGHARRRGQRRDRLLDREHRPDGRPHGRLRHRRAQQTLTDRQYQKLRDQAIAVIRAGRRRDGRLQRAVRRSTRRPTRSW